MVEPSEHSQSGDDLPELREWKDKLQVAQAAFDRALADARQAGGDDGLCHVSNALIQFWLAVGAANEEIGHPLTQAAVRAITLSEWPSREVSRVEMRAIATAIAYQSNLRLSGSGVKDSRMDAALLAAAHHEGLKSDDAAESVRKSLQRLRAKVRGRVVFSLDPITLQISHKEAEAALFAGLPGKRGRPRRQTQTS